MGPFFVVLAAMIGMLFLLSPLILLGLHIELKNRQRRLEARLNYLAAELDRRAGSLQEQVAGVEVTAAAPPAAKPPPVAAAEPPFVAAAEPPPVAAAGPPSVAPAEPPPAAAPAPAPPAVASGTRIPAGRATLAGEAQRAARTARTSGDWEAVIGGDWLNKLGALVLVVGIALLLAYSVAHLGAVGRVALGLAVSVAMLAIGVAMEGREQYRIFAQGLLGGGWAGLYFTTYAMHGLEAARIVDSPLIGTLLLLAVAVGMIAHSLYYRSQTITGLAYFICFVTLAISPLSRFALLASVPVAASLLFVAQRFRWERMAIAGLVLSYGSFLLRYEGLAAGGPEAVDWTFGQALLMIYWLIFEAFDLMAVARGRVDKLGHTLFPLNACGFLGISILEWTQASPANLSLFFAIAGAAYLASAMLRARFVEGAALPADGGAEERIEAMSYEAAITVAAVLFAIGIHMRFGGWRETVALLLEAQMLFLSGLALRQGFLRGLGAAAMALPVLRVVMVDLPIRAEIEVAGAALRQGTPVALLTAAVLYGSRGLLRTGRALRAAGAELLFTWFGSLILAFVIGYEAPAAYASLGWLALAVLLFESSLPARLAELRYQAYGVATIAWIDILAASVLGIAPGPERMWTLLVPAVVLSYGASARLWLRPAAIGEEERRGAFELSSLAGTAIAATAIWHLAPVVWVAVGWLLLGLLLVEIGMASREPSLRLWGHMALLAAFGRTFMANFADLGVTAGTSHRLITVLPMIAAYYYLAARLLDAHPSGAGAAARAADALERALRRLYLYAPAILGAVLVRFELGRAEAVLGWTAMCLALLYGGLRRDQRDLRLQAYALAVLVFVRAWATNFMVAGEIFGLRGRLVTGVLVTAGLFAAYLLVPRDRDFSAAAGTGPFDRMIAWLDERSRIGLSLLATALLAAFLFYEVSGSLLTVAWGLQGTTLLIAGFALRERQLRLSGLLLLGLCIAKAFAYDIQQLETVFRIVSFIVLGSLLLAVSFLYSRYREQLRRWL